MRSFNLYTLAVFTVFSCGCSTSATSDKDITDVAPPTDLVTTYTTEGDADTDTDTDADADTDADTDTDADGDSSTYTVPGSGT